MNEINTILFDVGWPIIDETEAHRSWNERLIEILKKQAGKNVTPRDILTAEKAGVDAYAPSLFSYVIWCFTEPDEDLFFTIRSIFDNFYENFTFRLQDGIIDVLEHLKGRFKLGLAANQPACIHDFLKANGILDYFDSKSVSEEIGFSKPDLRMFQIVLDALKSDAENCLMIGDRMDNDIIPARLLGMKTALLNVGPHKNQRLRYPSERPDYIIKSVADIIEIPLIKSKI